MGTSPSKDQSASQRGRHRRLMSTMAANLSNADLLSSIRTPVSTHPRNRTGRSPDKLSPTASPPPYAKTSAVTTDFGPKLSTRTSPIDDRPATQSSPPPELLPSLYAQPGEEVLSSTSVPMSDKATFSRGRVSSEGFIRPVRPTHTRAGGSFDFTKRIGRNLHMLGGRRKRAGSAASATTHSRQGSDGPGWILVQNEGDADISKPFNTQHDLHVSPDLTDLPSEWQAELQRLGVTEHDMTLMAAARRRMRQSSASRTEAPGAADQTPKPLNQGSDRGSSTSSSAHAGHARAFSTPDALPVSKPIGIAKRHRPSPSGITPTAIEKKVRTDREQKAQRTAGAAPRPPPLKTGEPPFSTHAYAQPDSDGDVTMEPVSPTSSTPLSPYTQNGKRLSAELRGFAALRIEGDDDWAGELWNAVEQKQQMSIDPVSRDRAPANVNVEELEVPDRRQYLPVADVARRSSSTLSGLRNVSQSSAAEQHKPDFQAKPRILSYGDSQRAKLASSDKHDAAAPQDDGIDDAERFEDAASIFETARTSPVPRVQTVQSQPPTLSIPPSDVAALPAALSLSPETASPGDLASPGALPALRFEQFPHATIGSGRTSPPPWTRSALPQPPSIENLRRKNRISEALSTISAADSNHSLGDLGSATVNTAYSADVRLGTERQGGDQPRVGRPRTFFLPSEGA